MDDRRLSRRSCSSKCSRKIGAFFNDRTVAAERECIAGKIRIAQIGGNHTAGIFAFLMHADGTVDTVVGDENDHGQLVLDGGREILPGHQEITVARHAHDNAVAMASAGKFSRSQTMISPRLTLPGTGVAFSPQAK